MLFHGFAEHHGAMLATGDPIAMVK